TFRLTHARFGIEKEYHVVVTCPEELDEPLLEGLRRGVMLEDGPARAVRASIVRRSAHGGGLLRVVLVEGRQRQVRRMLAALGCRYFDTGLLYRALTWLALDHDISPEDAAKLAQLVGELDLEVDPLGRVAREGVDLTDQLQQPSIDAAVSTVSAHPVVREAM